MNLAATASAVAASSLLAGDVAYGPDPDQRLDVYGRAAPAAAGSPVLVMVHGGAWRFGDKTSRAVVDAKVAHWVQAGMVVVSVNYRLDVAPDRQAEDVAAAIGLVTAQAVRWGGDSTRLVVMGHSAGAHLAALVAAIHSFPGLRGLVLLDSAVLDVPALMAGSPYRLYRRAFGTDPGYWRTVSPVHRMTAPPPPVLAVCSTRRPEACVQARAYAARAVALGGRVQVLAQDLSHRAINADLGESGAYTAEVDAFLAAVLGR